MTMTALEPVRVVFVAQDGQEFPVRYEAGEEIPMSISVQRRDGRVERAVAMPSRTTRVGTA